ncbi:UPF0158 family protein [Salegentibacter sp. JZCK2]|uniref:UPF0158 family protein n=1 Tax=Salegentibacter tibetensis TaxID=2873600 RepID=UPI001CCA56D3|nr:UPF0158 family protein [Salegentibacter tibetensis]MBZ9730562.1 UPF0158 family protein [Salegentibacter tibetensis]
MKVKEANIREMAELLLCGQLCFLNTMTGDFEYHPAEMDFFVDEENPWQDVIDKLENNWGDYIRIEPMHSTQSYAVMESFADQLEADGFEKKLLAALNRPKPFRNFNYLIHESDFRQEWFDYRQERNVEWVREQISDRVDE